MKLLIRADASREIGTGHVMRCLALAEAWQDRAGEVVFLIPSGVPELKNRLESEGMEVQMISGKSGSPDDCRQTISAANKAGAGWLAVDGYCFDASYQHHLKDSGLRVCWLDDYDHAHEYCADLVLNMDLSADEKLYANRSPATRLLLGPRYVLFRREFLEWTGRERNIPPTARKVLVTMGGSDPDNVTLKVIEAIRSVATDRLEITVLAGASNPHYDELYQATRNFPYAIELKRDVTDIADIMVQTDIAISAGGGTSWELLLLGTPSMILVLAENQDANIRQLERQNAIVNLGRHDRITGEQIASHFLNFCKDYTLRSKMSRKGRSLVDGQGAIRVVNSMLETFRT